MQKFFVECETDLMCTSTPRLIPSPKRGGAYLALLGPRVDSQLEVHLLPQKRTSYHVCCKARDIVGEFCDHAACGLERVDYEMLAV